MTDKEVDYRFSVTTFHSAYEFNWDPQFAFSGESHDFWEAVYVADGSVVVTEDARVYALKRGDIIFHHPMEFHNIRSADSTAPHVKLFTFSVDGAMPEKIKDGVFSLTDSQRWECEQLCDKILAYFCEEDTDEFSGMECAWRLTNFLVTLCRASHGNRQMIKSGSAREYRRLVKSMNTHIHDNFTLEQFANENAVSISYIKVLFYRYAGISPKAYYSKLRCVEAIRLLESGRTASEVADLLNFSSPNYFSVFLKKMTGSSPARYKKTAEDR